ncbi:MAG TPA: M23 family metallopeptidase [Ferruginibacter sp.]|jgi:murein DD-endopeptidase MepM/ murein hydrolase activator NlpD|nr:M23 family metallopeptidase [Ferruginibacter sp.]
MRKIKYFYNTNTLRYEKLVTPLQVKLLRVFGFISTALVSSAIIITVYNRFIPKPADLAMGSKYTAMKDNYAALNDKVVTLQQQMSVLENRDNQVYRSIFEANPMPDSARAQLIEQKKEIDKVNIIGDDTIADEVAKTLNNLTARVTFQLNSYIEIEKLIKNQDIKLACIPAIQPVSNKDLTRIASGFGMRIDPVYGTPKMHKGLDFAAPIGTPIYATANGTIAEAGYNEGGYGNHVVINHGYGYETIYGHMVKVKVHAGERVTRGEIIGWVGSTGKSTGPHCHYEIHINGEAVDPVYFFYNDLNADQYDQLLKIAATGSAKSLD